MGVAQLDVELREGRGPAVHHEWSASQLVHAVAWLQRANARGADVLIRPAGAHGLVLIGGLDAKGLERMTCDGFAPAATVEVLPGRYEAWVKLSDAALPQEVRRAAGAGLARRCGGQRQVGGEPPFGWLAGFTHPVVERGRSAVSTEVRARDCHGRVAPAAAAYLAHVERTLNAARLGTARARAVDAMAAPPRVLPQLPQPEQRVSRDRDRG